MPDLFDAAIARDEALAAVLKEPWSSVALRALHGLPSGDYTGEDIRLRLIEEVGAPHHHNAWGALIMNAVRSGLLVAIGTYRHMKTTKSHGRKTPVYYKG